VCADAADDNALAVTKDAFYFLQENGYINFGVLPGELSAARVVCIMLPQQQTLAGVGQRWLATV
jgi:hypothetical protein